MLQRPLVFDLVRGSFVDGPGIRSVVFLKGCPLRCLWCHNPVSQSPNPQIIFKKNRCIACLCCAEGCDTGALVLAGRFMTPQQLAKALARDRDYYKTSGGGVTFSGGEPLVYPEYLGAAAALLKKEGIHVAVETCGYFDYERAEKSALPHIDLMLFDLKLADTEEHKRYTGAANTIIHNNLRRLAAETKITPIPRIPVIAGCTDHSENIAALRNLCAELSLPEPLLLPENRWHTR